MSDNAARQLFAAVWKSLAPVISGAGRGCPINSSSITSRSFSKLRQGIPHKTANFSRPQSYGIPRFGSVRSFAYGGIFAASCNPAKPAAETAVTACTKILENKLNGNYNSLDRRKISDLLRATSKREAHTSSRSRGIIAARRGKSSSTGSQDASKASKPRAPDSKVAPASSDLLSSFNKGVASTVATKHLMDRLPHIPHMHRPTKEEFLALATGFWSRMKIRFKWHSIRSLRPFNSDEIGAFFSWVVLGHVLWIILGTTTFFSLAIFAVNTVFAQETLARWVGNYLTKSSGVKVVFESAIVPKWGDGVITFKNVFVSRRPGQGQGKVSKGSPETAAAAAAATVVSGQSKESGDTRLSGLAKPEDEDTNYTQFDVSIETVNVTLSFAKWFNSKGLLRDVEVKGVRGVIDRTHVHYSGEHIDPLSYRHEHNPGDFEIDSFKMEDLLVTIHQPHGFRPFSVSIFFCDLPQLRRQWLFYDFLSANTMSGSFDESLFTIHPHQMHGHAGSQILQDREINGSPNPWKKHSRLRIDGLSIDHLNRGVEGPFSWIHEGNVDIIADVMFPADNDESIAKVVANLYDQIEATVTSKIHLLPEEETTNVINNDSDEDPTFVPPEAPSHIPEQTEDRRFLIMDMKLHFNDVRAAVPLFTKDLSYVKNALIRPIVGYINSRRTFIPINCRVVKRINDFDGSWTLFDSGLMDDVSAETYTAIARDVTDDQARLRRFKKVGLWSLQLAVQAVFMGMAGGIA